MNNRLFVQTLQAILFLFWGSVFGAIVFEQSSLNTLSHNVTHFVTFWCVFVTGWFGVSLVSKSQEAYRRGIVGNDLNLSFVCLGTLVWISARLLFVIFIA